MGKIVKANLPCLNPECNSHDARQVYENGTSFCFSCRGWFKPNAEDGEVTASPSPRPFAKPYTPPRVNVEELHCRGFKERGITKSVNEFFGVKVSYNSEGEIDAHYYPYKTATGTSYKIRQLPKSFTWQGEAGDLFGIDKFPSGGKRLIITEGEIDALSVAQASMDKYQKIYPVISIPNAAAVTKLLEHREWIRSFQEVVLCMDNDEPGLVAREKALKIIGIDKAKIAKMPEGCKDASDVLVKEGTVRLMQVIWDAETWSPAGIVKKEELWKSLCELNTKTSIPYPPCMEGVNTKIKGQRTGEIVLLVSGTGAGKSTLVREIIINDLEVTTDKVGIISLEESPAETARKLAGMKLNRNPANEEIPIAELKPGFDAVFGDDRVVILDHQGSIKDDSIINQLEYMALIGCKYIFIDHITILVSEGADGLTGNEAIDKVMNDLLRLVKRHDVWVGLVSHLRKAPTGGKSFEEGKMPSIDDVRGSGSIKQISFDIIAFARNLIAENDIDRNTIKMSILKSRYTGLTGSVPGAFYEHTTGRLIAAKNKPVEQFTAIG